MMSDAVGHQELSESHLFDLYRMAHYEHDNLE